MLTIINLIAFNTLIIIPITDKKFILLCLVVSKTRQTTVTKPFNTTKKVEMININNEEIELFNKHINIITENRNNQIKMNEL